MSSTSSRDGVISFDWAINAYSAGQYGDSIAYVVDGVQTNLSTAGSASGTATSIAVSAGDTFRLQTWGSTQSSSYTASFTNFIFN